MISLSHTRGRGVVSIGETNVDVSVCVLHVILSDVPIPIGGGFKARHPDGVHAILYGGFDVVKVLPLHEVERATAVEMIRYGYPFAGVHRIFDLTVRFANRASDPWSRFLDGIVKHPEEITVGVDAMSWLVTASFTRVSKEFWFRGRKKLSRGRISSSEFRSSSSPSPTSSPLMEMMSHYLHH